MHTTWIAILVFGVIVVGCEEKAAPLPKSDASKTTPGNTYTPSSSSGGNWNGLGIGTSNGTNSVDCIRITELTGQTTLLAAVAQPVNWQFRAQCSDGSDIVVFRIDAVPRPPSMIINNTSSPNISLSWTPTQQDAPSGTINVTARNRSACNRDQGSGSVGSSGSGSTLADAQAQQLVMQACSSCHQSGGTPPALDTSYAITAARSAIGSSVANGTMPKPGSGVTQLATNDRTALIAWAQGNSGVSGSTYGSGSASCNDFTQTLTSYDKTQQFQYSLNGGTGSFGAGIGGGNVGTMVGLGAGIGLISGLLNGGGLGGALQGAITGAMTTLNGGGGLAYGGGLGTNNVGANGAAGSATTAFGFGTGNGTGVNPGVNSGNGVPPSYGTPPVNGVNTGIGPAPGYTGESSSAPIPGASGD